MALKGNFDQSAFEKRVQEVMENHRQKILKDLEHLGNECVADARSHGDYTDRTGNLRNSIGYVIFQDGEPVFENFAISAVGDGSKGISNEDAQDKSRNIAKQAASEYKGIVLVVVAGMKYAMYVESRGYNVLTSAELLANRELPKLLESLK